MFHFRCQKHLWLPYIHVRRNLTVNVVVTFQSYNVLVSYTAKTLKKKKPMLKKEEKKLGLVTNLVAE
jgi:hypothetical protein